MEDLLATEIRDFGGTDLKEFPGGISFTGSLETGYRTCLWSRIASRVLAVLDTFPVTTQDALYQGIFDIPWPEHFRRKHSFVVDAFVKDAVFTHSGFTAMRVKDAVADRFRDDTGDRPSVDTRTPDVRINLYLRKEEATVSIDLSGESLHRRHYRQSAGPAPLKENIAAAILMRGKWPEIAAAGGAFVDPMCGSGTLPVEAALMAGDIAPGRLRTRFGFQRWINRDDALWKTLLDEAEERMQTGLEQIPEIRGYDKDRGVIDAARNNIQHSGLEKYITVEKKNLEDAYPLQTIENPGLVAVNPPYGIRLKDPTVLRGLYENLGALLAEHYKGWHVSLITATPELAKALKIRAYRSNTLYNGPLKCKLYHFDLAGETVPTIQFRELPVDNFENRIQKNLKHISKWARRNNISCFRIYDADIPEFAVAVDLYEQKWCVVYEYAPPASVDQIMANRRLKRIIDVLPRMLGIHPDNIFLKIRRRQKGSSQYEKLQFQGKRHTIHENDLKYLVNFSDYLDTGIFLDHRPLRRLIREMSGNRTFLNLFAYTGTVTVAAAAGGALSTTTIDTSNTYLDWSEDNIALNGFSGDRHSLVRADCMGWLKNTSEKYDIIFLDPPTYSISGSEERKFEIQADHPELIRRTMPHLKPGGTLFFSTNFKKFRMDPETLAGTNAMEITPDTIPEDFKRTPRIHRVWKINR